MSVDYTDKDGETTTYVGVLLSDVLNNVNSSGETVIFTAADGYEAEMPMADAMACSDCIVAFDEGSLRMVMPEQSGKLQVKDVVEISIN
jgi:DMSO/TMAO reductase YedYZ molybdopterin-dependent catalytic subunit